MKARRYVKAAKATALSAAVVLSGLAGVGPAAATHLKCGSVITTDTTLTHDILGCKKPAALLIGADNVTLNLGGFVVGGLRSEVSTPIRGIHTQGHSGVVVTNGIVKGFDSGVSVSGVAGNEDVGGDSNTISRITAKANGVGIGLSGTRNTVGTTNTVVSASKIVGNQFSGLSLYGGKNNSVRNNTIYNNGRGIVSDFGSGHLIEGNAITYNKLDGVATLPSITVRDNDVSHNGRHGVYQSTHGSVLHMFLTISGNLICDNGGHGIGITPQGDGQTITDNNVGAGTTGCLPNARLAGYYDLYDEEAASGAIPWTSPVCPSTWRNNYTEGDTFNHPCVTK